MEKKYKLRLWLLLALIAVIGVFSQVGMNGGDTSQVRRIIGESSLYTGEEIEEAMDLVEKTFRREFKGCTLTELEYDEAYSQQQSQQWAQAYSGLEVLVLTSGFDVDSSGGDGSLNPNSSYSRWMWVLTRDRGEAWQLQTWGY